MVEKAIKTTERGSRFALLFFMGKSLLTITLVQTCLVSIIIIIERKVKRGRRTIIVKYKMWDTGRIKK